MYYWTQNNPRTHSSVGLHSYVVARFEESIAVINSLQSLGSVKPAN